MSELFRPKISLPVQISIITGLSAFSIYFMISSSTIVNPIISGVFDLNAAEMGFLIQAHLLGAVMFLIPAAKLGDRFGHIRIFSGGAIIFAVSSLFCSLSVSGIEIIFFRFIQGIGDGMMTACALVLITKVHPLKSRGCAIGFFLFAGYFGYISGLLTGSISAEIFGWQAVFLIPTPVILFAGFLAYKKSGRNNDDFFVSKSKHKFEEKRYPDFDTAGMLLFCPAIFMIAVGISGFLPGLRLIFLILGAVLFSLFLVIEKKSKNPLLMFSLFRKNRLFTYSVCADLLYYMTIGCIAYTLSIYLESGLYYSAFVTGILLLPASLMQGALSPVAGHLSDKIEPKYVTAFGMGLIVITLIFYANISETKTGLTLISLMLALTGTGYAFFSSPNKSAIMSSVKKEYQGEASGIANTTEQMGNIVSISIAATVITIFSGNSTITPKLLPEFLEGMHFVFLAMALLGTINIIICLRRGDVKSVP